MANYTAQDIANAKKFAETNIVIKKLIKLYEKKPNIASELKLELRKATSGDYFIPASLSHCSYVATVRMTKEACQLLTCNSMKETAPCTLEEEASYYHVGDKDFDLQCQPACFGLKNNPSYDESGKRAPDVPSLNWHQNKCRIVPMSILNYMEKPFYRSTIKFQRRLNDMPTGFSRIKSDNEYGCGIDYELNPTYCKYFDRGWSESEKNCALAWWEKVLDATIGLNVINSIRSKMLIELGVPTPFLPPDNLPNLPKLPQQFTKMGWSQHRNADFVLPTVIDTTPRNNRVRRSLKIKPEDLIPKENYLYDAYVILCTDYVKKTFQRFFTPLVDDLTSTDGKQKQELTLGIDVSLLASKRLAFKTIDVLSTYAINEMEALGARFATTIGENVLKNTLSNVALRVMTSTAIRIGSAMAINLSRILISATSVIGWILIAFQIFNLILSKWDPYGYNNLQTPEMLKAFMENGELNMRQEFKNPSADFEFEHLVNTILTNDEIMQIEISSLSDTAIYLNSLQVNSEGSRIDKGPPVNLKGNLNKALQVGTASRVKFTNTSLIQDSQTFMNRVYTNKIINIVGLICLGLGIVTTVVNLPILGLFLLIVACIVFALSKLELQDNLFINAMKNMNINKQSLNNSNIFNNIQR